MILPPSTPSRPAPQGVARHRRGVRRPLARALLLFVPLLAGCGSLVPTPPPPSALYALTREAAVPAIPSFAGVVRIETPVASDLLSTDRIAVRTQGSYAYLADVRWAGPLPEMVQTHLVATFGRAQMGDRVSRPGEGVKARAALHLEVQAFEVVRSGQGADGALVELSARLVDVASRRILAADTFSATADAGVAGAGGSVGAVRAAAEGVLDSIAVWTARSLAARDGQAPPQG